MMIMRRLGWVTFLFCAGCGGSTGLGQEYVPPPTPQGGDLGPLSPVQKDTRLWYNLQSVFRREGSDAQGATQGEAQTGGALCLRVDEIKDTSISAYKDANETLIIARVKATSTSGASDLDASDQNNPNATPYEVDALLQPLWLKRMMPSSTRHGFERPYATTFDTQSPPLPDKGLQQLLFFDPRELANKNWGGWESIDEKLTKNFLNTFLQYFLEPPYGQAFFLDSHKFRMRKVTPSSTCSTATDVQHCPTEGCTWTTPPGGNQSQCMSLYTLRVLWRENMAAPIELAGPVVHMLELMYDQRGILFSANEIIEKDQWVDDVLPSGITSCADVCMSAGVSNWGSWETSASDAPCSF